MASRGRVRQRDHHFDIVCSQRPRRLSARPAPHRLLCHPSGRRAAVNDVRLLTGHTTSGPCGDVVDLQPRCSMIRGIYGNARELPPRRHWLRITGDRNVARLRVGSFDATSRRIKCRLQCVSGASSRVTRSVWGRHHVGLAPRVLIGPAIDRRGLALRGYALGALAVDQRLHIKHAIDA
jgi:hypothetical protein